jgi:hypothetical protein
MAKISDCQMGRHKWIGYKCTQCGISATKFDTPIEQFSLQGLISQMDGVLGEWTIYMSPGSYEQFRKLIYEKSEESLPKHGPAEFLGCEVVVSNDIISGHGRITYYMVPRIKDHH